MKYGLLAILTILMQKGLAQNLVPNPSFEYYTSCPQNTNQLYLAEPWYSSSLSPDYYNPCSNLSNVGVPINTSGFQYAYEGIAYAGLSSYDGLFDTREMMSVKLISPLVAESTYCIDFYISSAEEFTYSSNNIGFYFSNDSINFGNYLFSILPQINFNAIISDTSKWHNLSSVYIANGGEEYITIGNFYNNAATNIKVINDTIQHPYAYYYIDDISIYECDKKDIDIINKPNVFTPNGDGYNDVFEIQFLPPQSQLTVYSRWGNQVYTTNDYQNNWDGNGLSDGVYFYVLTLPSGNSTKGTITILRDN